MAIKYNIIITIILFLTIVQSQIYESIDSTDPSAIKNAYLSSLVGYPTKTIYTSTSPTSSNCCSDNTISVSGFATINASPDLAILSAQMSASGDTVKQAIAKLTIEVNKVLKILS